MCYTPYVDIVSNIMTKNQAVQDNDSTLRNGTAKLARIYLRNENIENCFDTDDAGNITKCNIIGCRPFSFRREFKTPKVIMWNTTENVDVIDLQVIDRLGFPIYIETVDPRTTVEGQIFAKFGNTANFQFTIQASET
jgi:archaellin